MELQEKQVPLEILAQLDTPVQRDHKEKQDQMVQLEDLQDYTRSYGTRNNWK